MHYAGVTSGTGKSGTGLPISEGVKGRGIFQENTFFKGFGSGEGVLFAINLE